MILTDSLTKLDQTSFSSALPEMSDATENVLCECCILPRLNQVHYTNPGNEFRSDSPGIFVSCLEMNAEELQWRECGEGQCSLDATPSAEEVVVEKESRFYTRYQTSSQGNSFCSLIHFKRKHLCLPAFKRVWHPLLPAQSVVPESTVLVND